MVGVLHRGGCGGERKTGPEPQIQFVRAPLGRRCLHVCWGEVTGTRLYSHVSSFALFFFLWGESETLPSLRLFCVLLGQEVEEAASLVSAQCRICSSRGRGSLDRLLSCREGGRGLHLP